MINQAGFGFYFTSNASPPHHDNLLERGFTFTHFDFMLKLNRMFSYPVMLKLMFRTLAVLQVWLPELLGDDGCDVVETSVR